MHRVRRFRRLAAVLALPALLGLAGCSGKGQVSGQVTYKGKVVPSGRITFLGAAGDHIAKSTPIIDGRYTLTDFPAGPAMISVETFAPARDGAAPPAPAAMPMKAPKGDNPYAASSLDKYVWVPPQFANPDKSGLKYTVTAGKQDHPVELGQ